MTKETYFEELSFALRRRELLPRPVEEDGLLPVEWNGRVLCRVTEAAGTIMKYMKLLETAPPLKAESLADGYRVLAEFNGTVLAGKKTLLGAQFVTWAWDYDRRGVSNGHYYMEDYQTAKEDFTFRSGLMAREQVFDRERLEELRQAGVLARVQGLLYLSDGWGDFPDAPPDYPVSFLIPQDPQSPGFHPWVPSWVTTLYLDTDHYTVKEASA